MKDKNIEVKSMKIESHEDLLKALSQIAVDLKDLGKERSLDDAELLGQCNPFLAKQLDDITFEHRLLEVEAERFKYEHRREVAEAIQKLEAVKDRLNKEYESLFKPKFDALEARRIATWEQIANELGADAENDHLEIDDMTNKVYRHVEK